MVRTWVVGCTHFGHDNIYKFTDRTTGERIRPFANNAEEGDEIMRTVWNERVAPDDKVYHLGDVAIPRRGLKCLEGLHGRKVLIGGNHDIFKLKDYAEYFENIVGSYKIADVVMAHIPTHPNCFAPWQRGLIHAHIHSNKVLLPDGTIDPLFQNASIEYSDRGPIEFEEVRARFPEIDKDRHFL